MKPAILVGARGFWSMKELIEEEVFHGKFKLEFDENVRGPDEMRREVIALVVADQRIDAAVFDRFPNMRTIARTGTGYDNIDMRRAHERGVVVTRVAKLNANSVSEFALGLTLNLLRHVPEIHHDMLRNVWKRNTGLLLTDVTVGIVGLGAIGQLLVRKFYTLGTKRIIGWNRTLRTDIPLLQEECRLELCDNLPELAAESDVLVVALALAPETKKCINRDVLSHMKREALVVNIGRGALVDEEALAEYIAEGTLGGAALDVFSSEPPQSVPFEQKFIQRLIESANAGKNVILTPHNAGITKHSVRNISLQVAHNIVGVLNCRTENIEIVTMEGGFAS